MDEISVIVFADGDVIGHHAGALALRQDYSYVDIALDDVQSYIGQSLVDGYGVINTGEGSYLVSAALRCLGLGVRPGGIGGAAAVRRRRAVGVKTRPVGPADQAVAVLGDPSSMDFCARLTVSGSKARPRAQLLGPGEAGDVADLDDEHRGQHESDAGQGPGWP